MMSYKMNARIKDGAMTEKSGCFGFAGGEGGGFIVVVFFSTRQVQEAE